MADRVPKRSYISMRAYNNDIFSYTTSIVNDFQTVGTIGAVTGATASNCPQGRILTETGRKLYPGANPGITQLMVGVFDYATGLSGFIDPNSSAFTPQNTDRPYYFTSPGANTVDPDPNRAPPVFTRGDVLAQGNLDLSGAAHIYGAAEIDGVTTMNSNAIIQGTTTIGSGGTPIQRVTKGTVAVNFSVPADNRITQSISIPGMSNGDMVFLQYEPAVDRRLFYVGHDTATNVLNLYVNNTHSTNLNFSTTISYMWFKM